jgi:hypothetical protein
MASIVKSLFFLSNRTNKEKAYLYTSAQRSNIMFILTLGERKTINSELWHACAGPLVSLPPVGSLVVYFPQGHSEQVCFISDEFYERHVIHISVFWLLMKSPLTTLTFRLRLPCKNRPTSYPVTPIFHPS